MYSSDCIGRPFATCWGGIYPPHEASSATQAGPKGWDESDHKDNSKGESQTLSSGMFMFRKEEETVGAFPHYLHVGEGAGQGASTWPPLLLQSSAQHLKLSFLLPHRGQQGGRARTLLHSHAESRAEDRTGQNQHQRAVNLQPAPGAKPKDRTNKAYPNTLIRNTREAHSVYRVTLTLKSW